ncbi:M48 family metalloprotease [Azospirillum sp. ST 5-10]|uniref:M48 family metallopeptidase n=1 Tax=unclassified Azospirillum TaxID=2630922 RepID=UPI003F49BFDC
MSGPDRRRMLAGAGCACATLALAACATGGGSAVAPLAPGYRPAAETDEAGLWRSMEKAEAELRQSRHRIRDPELNAYVHDLACHLAGDHCRDVRTYLLRTPHFNASMAPNGMMQVWSGLLLRCHNEAQLAAVLGHEIGHFLQRHTISNWRQQRDGMDVAAFLSLGLAVAGVGGLSNLTNMMVLAGVFSYRRDQEREADDIGIELMAKAGYAPVEASKVWEQMVAEKKAADEDSGAGLLFATHPGSEERMETLRQRADTLARPGQGTGTEAYRQALRGIRLTLFQDELRLRQFPRTLVLLDRMERELPQDADVHFFGGELYRLRDEGGDEARARAAYERALALPDAPPLAWRGYGLVLRAQGDRRAASDALRRYLEAVPDAPDRALIQSYIGV